MHYLKNYIIKKPNIAILKTIKLHFSHQKIINLAIAIRQNTDKNNIVISYYDVEKYFYGRCHIPTLNKFISSLEKFNISFFKDFSIQYNKINLTFCNNFTTPLNKDFTTIDLSIINRFSSKYSIALYEFSLFKRNILKSKNFYLEKQEFIDLFLQNENSYTKDVNTEVIKRALKDINAFSDVLMKHEYSNYFTNKTQIKHFKNKVYTFNIIKKTSISRG